MSLHDFSDLFNRKFSALKLTIGLPSYSRIKLSERWMLLHVEVQGKNEKGFAERMFRYSYRILDRYDRDVAAIAILTGSNGKNIPDKYERRSLWGRTLYEYKTLCITDYTDDVLSASNNPFAVVMLVAKEALLKLSGSDEQIDKTLIDQKTGKTNTMGIIDQLAEIKAEEAPAVAIENAGRLFVENLLKESDFSQVKIASLANVPLSFAKKVKKGLPSK